VDASAPSEDIELRDHDWWYCRHCKAAVRLIGRVEDAAAGGRLVVVDRHSVCGHVIAYRGARDFFR
jgi:hypothetical protein